MREAVVPYVAAASLRLGVECLVGLGLESLCCAFLCSRKIAVMATMMSSSVRVWVSTVALMRFADATVSGLTSVAPGKRLLGAR